MQWENNGVRIGSRSNPGNSGNVYITQGADQVKAVVHSDRIAISTTRLTVNNGENPTNTENLYVNGNARITSTAVINDNVLMGNTTQDFNYQVKIFKPDSRFKGLLVQVEEVGLGVHRVIEFTRGDGTVMGRIESSAVGNTTSYLSGSDSRLKTNFKDFEALKLISNMKPLEYERKSNLGTKEYGFKAQELYDVLPQAVGVGGDDPEIDPWSVDYGQVTGVLTKAIQELSAENDSLKEELNSIKAMLQSISNNS
jgi:hypothetical protein